MKPYTRQASVIWRGTESRGNGVVSTPSAVLRRAAYTFDSQSVRHGTNPPELLAAAHAGSFSMTLAKELGEAGYRPTEVKTTATVTMEKLAALWTMTQIHLDVTVTAPKMAQCDFIDAALRAKANCPISRSLNGNISMRAQLSHREGNGRLRPRAASPGRKRRRLQRLRLNGRGNSYTKRRGL